MASQQLLDIFEPNVDPAGAKTNNSACKFPNLRRIVNSFLVVVLLTLSVVCIISVLQYNEDISLSDVFNKTHTLHTFCCSFNDCYAVEQSFTREDGTIHSLRWIRYIESSIDIYNFYKRIGKLDTVAELETPSVLTKEYVNPLHWKVNKAVLSPWYTYDLMQIAAGFVFGSLSLTNTTHPQRVLLIGLGCGNTANFLSSMPLNLSIVVVEQEHAVHDVAKRFFELESDKLRVHIGNPGRFNAVIDATFSFITHYESIIIDACVIYEKEQRLTCPNAVFLKHAVVENLSKLIGVTGILTITVKAKDGYTSQALKEITSAYKEHFRRCAVLIPSYSRRAMILVCTNRDGWSYDVWSERSQKNLRAFDEMMCTNVYGPATTLYEQPKNWKIILES